MLELPEFLPLWAHLASNKPEVRMFATIKETWDQAVLISERGAVLNTPVENILHQECNTQETRPIRRIVCHKRMQDAVSETLRWPGLEKDWDWPFALRALTGDFALVSYSPPLSFPCKDVQLDQYFRSRMRPQIHAEHLASSASALGKYPEDKRDWINTRVEKGALAHFETKMDNEQDEGVLYDHLEPRNDDEETRDLLCLHNPCIYSMAVFKLNDKKHLRPFEEVIWLVSSLLFPPFHLDDLMSSPT